MVKLVDMLLLGSVQEHLGSNMNGGIFPRRSHQSLLSYVEISIQSISIVIDQSYLSIIDLIRE
jgi:hypothetical protein